jgi:D-alanyl-D-alanine carboxypeptidase
VTKSFVAAVVLRLVAEGRLALSDTLEGRLPGTLPYGDRVSVGRLLNHTGGVPHNAGPVERTLYGSRQGRLRSWSPRELVALVADRPPDFPPGTAWAYSNTGYILLGLVVEAVTGNPLAQELDRCILGPLGLAGTSLPTDAPASRARRRAATACPAARAGTRWTACCSTSPSRTPRTPGRRARWCPTSRTSPASSGPC